MSIYPKSVLDEVDKGEQLPAKQMELRQRIELALHPFNCGYPVFPYGDKYEFAYHIAHDPNMIRVLDSIARTTKKDGRKENRRDLLHNIQALSIWVTEQLDNDPQMWNHLRTVDEDEDEDEEEEGTSVYSAEDLELWDYCVDDELTDEN